MDIIQWILDNGNRVQLTLSTFEDDLDIEMRLYESTVRCRQLLDKKDLAQMDGHLTDVLDWMLYELLKDDMRI